MKRLIMDELIKWKNRINRKPLILKGVRQCGKTYILEEFGRRHYKEIAYFNFEGNPALAERFEQDLEPERIISELGVLNGKKIEAESTLIIFDEIQFCNKALTFLKYLHEKAPRYHLVCAGSLLGISLSRPLSFPVGKVDFLTLRPMNFYEFLLAAEQKMLIDYINELDGNSPVPTIFAQKLINLLKTYYITGGMPEVVAGWLGNNDISEVERLQDMIIDSYELDFAKHAAASEFPKLSLIWRGIPGQLAKENSKFIYGHVKAGARAKDLEDAIEWLRGAGLVYKVCKIEKAAIPLSAYANANYFKIYTADVGVLRRLSKIPAASIIEDSRAYAEYKGALTENYVLTELLAIPATEKSGIPYYWKSGNTAEVDFILQSGEKIVPVEVKSSTNVRSRSLAEYRKKYRPEKAVRTSMQNLRIDDNLINIPLYMLWTLDKYL